MSQLTLNDLLNVAAEADSGFAVMLQQGAEVTAGKKLGYATTTGRGPLYYVGSEARNDADFHLTVSALMENILAETAVEGAADLYACIDMEPDGPYYPLTDCSVDPTARTLVLVGTLEIA